MTLLVNISNCWLTGNMMCYDSCADDKTFKEGVAVWVYNPQRRIGLTLKLMHPWEEPYTDAVYPIQLIALAKPTVVQINHLWDYTGGNQPSWYEAAVETCPQMAEIQDPEQELSTDFQEREKTVLQHSRFTAPCIVCCLRVALSRLMGTLLKISDHRALASKSASSFPCCRDNNFWP